MIHKAIVSFLAVFFVVNHKVHETEKGTFDLEARSELPVPVDKVRASPIWSYPNLAHVGPFNSKLQTHVLRRCLSLSVFLATLGFVLAMVGIGYFAWGRHPASASIFCTIWIGVSAVLVVCILVVPDINLVEWWTERPH